MQRLRNHLLFWTLYVLFKTYLNISADATDFLMATGEEWDYYVRLFIIQLCLLSIKVPLVYSCFWLLDHYLLRKWNLLQTVLSFLAVFLVAVLLMSALNHSLILPKLLRYTQVTFSWLSINSLVYHFFTLAFVVGIAVSIRLLRRQYHSSMREIVLQKEKVETELKYLKGQINPHFLFNTLNNIYSLARKGSSETAESVLKLSKLMRFMLYNAGHHTIMLTEELSLIEDYIALERLRYTDRLQVTYNQNLDNLQQRIAPLLLIHFVENAFKHGASETRFESFITIDITLRNGVLRAQIQNSKSTDGMKSDIAKPIGMENIKRQLDIIYPEHQLVITDNINTFQVDLTIPLNH